jgi:hypothetical protein
VIRLCGPYSRLSPPFAGFPYELRHVLEGPAFLVEGGIQVDGKEISKVRASELLYAKAGAYDRSTSMRLEEHVQRFENRVSRL